MTFRAPAMKSRFNVPPRASAPMRHYFHAAPRRQVAMIDYATCALRHAHKTQHCQAQSQVLMFSQSSIDAPPAAGLARRRPIHSICCQMPATSRHAAACRRHEEVIYAHDMLVAIPPPFTALLPSRHFCRFRSAVAQLQRRATLPQQRPYSSAGTPKNGGHRARKRAVTSPRFLLVRLGFRSFISYAISGRLGKRFTYTRAALFPHFHAEHDTGYCPAAGLGVHAATGLPTDARARQSLQRQGRKVSLPMIIVKYTY